MKIERRGFLGAMLAVAMAPAIIRAESLMKIAPPKIMAAFTLYGDGLHDDTVAINALLAGNLVQTAAGVLLRPDAGRIFLPVGNYAMSSPLITSSNSIKENT